MKRCAIVGVAHAKKADALLMRFRGDSGTRAESELRERVLSSASTRPFAHDAQVTLTHRFREGATETRRKNDGFPFSLAEDGARIEHGFPR